MDETRVLSDLRVQPDRQHRREVSGVRGGDNHREGRIMKNVTRRQRLRGTCKWGGITLCVLLFALWLVSGWAEFDCLVEPARGPDTCLVVRRGCVTCNASTYRDCFRPPAGLQISSGAPGWDWWRWETAFLEPSKDPRWLLHSEFPLWLPFLLIALPTGFLLWSDHRKRIRGGCVECGYDLTGNTSGKCPECGATSTARVASS